METDPNIRVSGNAGVIDTLTAAGRYATVIVTLFPVLLVLLKSGDLIAIATFFQGSDGAVFVAAVVGLGTIAWGLKKTFRRGKEVAIVAADTRVPSEVADLK